MTVSGFGMKRGAKRDDETVFLMNGMRYITEASSVEDALRNIVAAAATTVGSDCGSLYLLNSENVLEPYILHNFPDAYLEGCRIVPLGKQCCGRAALHKMPWVVEDMWTDPLFADCREAAKKAGMRSGISVPVLMADGTCVGTLAAQFREMHHVSKFNIERLRLFARLIAFAITREHELAGEASEMKPSASAKGIRARGDDIVLEPGRD